MKPRKNDSCKPVIIKTNDENYWFELSCDSYNWIITECDRGMKRNPRNGELNESVTRNSLYPSTLINCLKYIYDEMLKNKIDGQDILAYIEEIRQLQKEIFNIFKNINFNEKDYKEYKI